MVALPLVMSWFKMISVVGPVVAVLLYPLTAAVVVGGFIHLLVAAAAGESSILLTLTDWAGTALTKTTQFASQIPWTHLSVLPPPAILIVGYYALLIWIVLSHRPDDDAFETGAASIRQTLRRLFRPTPKKHLLAALVAAYLTYWVLTAHVFSFRRAGSCEIVAAHRGGNQAVAVCAGRDIVIVDFGGAGPNQITDLVTELKVKHLARLRGVFLTFPDQRFFNDLPLLTQTEPGLNVFASAAFIPMRDYHQPVAYLFDAQLLSEGSLLDSGATVHGGECQITLLYPSRSVAATVIDMNQRATKMKGTPRLRRLCDLGAVYLISAGGTRLIVCSMLGPIACEMMSRHYPDLRAEALVLNAKSPVGNALEGLIRQLGIGELIVCGRPSSDARRWYERTCKALSANLTIVENRCATRSVTKRPSGPP